MRLPNALLLTEEAPAMTPLRLRIIAPILSLGLAPSAWAYDVDLSSDGNPLEVHAFVSQGFMKSTDNNYLVKSKAGSFAATEVGLNVTKSLTDRLRVGIQLFGGGFIPAGHYNAKMDWFYLDYHWRDWLGIRAGRVKLPFGLYNEISDIDSARLPILLPQSTYPVTNRNFLLAQTGLEIYGYLGRSMLGALEYRLYGGTIIIDLPPTTTSPVMLVTLDTAYVAGGRLMWELPLEGLRVGGSVEALRLDAAFRIANMPVDVEVPAVLWVSSAEYAVGDFLFASEYGRWHSRVNSGNETLYPPSKSVSERFYAMAGYHLSPSVQLGAYYSGYVPNVYERHGRAAVQNDFAATFRFDINAHWLIKLEGHFMRGTAALNAGLNDNRMPSELTRDWGLFFAQTTAYF
jgi:hypothetical protein